MEMLRSLRGDKHEFCLTVIKYRHVRSCPSFDITYTYIFGVSGVSGRGSTSDGGTRGAPWSSSSALVPT